MSTINDLRPGDIGFGPIHGAAGALVNVGQLMLGEGFHVGSLDIRHVFMVTQAAGPRTEFVRSVRDIVPPEKAPTTPAYCVEAMPGGARNAMIADRWTSEYAYVRIPEDYAGQSQDAASIAREMIGTPYSFASYAALAAWRFGLKTPRLEKWIDRRREPLSADAWLRSTRSLAPLALPAEAICSVLADQAWSLAGKQVMHGVAHQCVTPGALAATLLEMPGAQWFWPGRD